MFINAGSRVGQRVFVVRFCAEHFCKKKKVRFIFLVPDIQ